jgi:LysM repeat protein
MSPGAASAATAAAVHPAVLDALVTPAAVTGPAEVNRQASANVMQQGSAAALSASYRVRPGDSLSSIAVRVYHDRAAWPVLYWRNHKEIHWANDIYAGQVLQVPAKPAHIPAPPGALQQPAPAVTSGSVPAQAAGQPSTAAAAVYSGGTPGGAFGACVIARESGGSPQIVNATGHYGLYQFSEATWAAYGGNPADFGHASVAEQNQVFANALAAGGESNWAPYDGC